MADKAPETVSITVRMDAQLLELMKADAVREDRTVSNVLSRLVKLAYCGRYGRLPEGLMADKVGNVIQVHGEDFRNSEFSGADSGRF